MRGLGSTVALTAGCIALAASAGELPPEIARVLAGHSIPASDVSIVVQAVDSAEPVLSHLPDAPRNPASVMKTVTTWTALESLGPTYSWPTEVSFLGPFDGETLSGDIAFKGYGDPFLVVEEFWKLLRTLRRSGLQQIKGDFVFDDSFFDVDDPDPGAFDGDPYRTYNVVPNALLMNFEAVQFQFFPDVPNRRVTVATDPILANLDIRNRLKLVDAPCRGFQRGISFAHSDAEALDHVVIDGDYSQRCNSYTLARTALHPDTYAFGLFESLWRELGGRFTGRLEHRAVPDDASPALVWRSVPLAEVIRSINKNSNNVMTRQLVYTLGAERSGPPGTRAKGIAAIREFLMSRGIDTTPLVLRNGAGLSRDERVSARLLVDVLRGAATSPYAPEFIASLSLGGLDGTTRGRFGVTPADGVLHLKTGRIDDVSALAGFVHTGTRTYVMAVLLNAPQADKGPGDELETAVIRWVEALH